MVFHSLVCGVCGAFASMFGKLAFAHDNPLSVYIGLLCTYMGWSAFGCEVSILILNITCFGIMISLNAAMIATFLKALESSSSVFVTVVSSAVNYILTAAVGASLFDEAVGSKWLLGSSLVCIGLCIVTYSQNEIVNTEGRAR